MRQKSFALLSLLLLIVGFMPLPIAHAQHLWAREHYQFFPLVLVGAGLLAYRELRLGVELVPGKRVPALVLWGCSWILLALAILLQSPWLAAVASLVTLVAAFYALGAWPLLRKMFPAWIFLWLTIPPPFGLDQRLIGALQDRTSQWSSRLLDTLGVFHNLAGHVVEIGSQKFLVEEACSGIHSLFAVLACTLLFVLWQRRSLLHAMLLLIASAGWALVDNVCRVAALVFLAVTANIDLTTGWRHEFLGVISFLLILGFIASTDRLLDFFMPFLSLQWLFCRRIRPQDAADDPPPETNRLGLLETLKHRAVQVLDRRSWWPVAFLYGLLVLVQIAYLWPTKADAGTTADLQPLVGIENLNEDSLPAAWGDWKRTGFGPVFREHHSAFGQHSLVWHYSSKATQMRLSLDYPFPGWRELTDCYRGIGWHVEDSRETTYKEAKLRKPLDKYGFLVFTAVDQRGHILGPAAHDPVAMLQKRVTAWRLPGQNHSSGLEELGACLQIQLFLESHALIATQEQDEAVAFFQQARDQLLRACQKEAALQP